MDINALKQAMSPLLQVGKKEIHFEIEGTKLSLRPLLPVEEVAVQRYAASVLDQTQRNEGLTDQDQMSKAAALDYFDRFRIEIISYSIAEVNGLSLRGVDTIETGEVLENGTPVRVSRPMAMRQIVEQWSRAMITVCFAKYGDMIRRIAEEAEKMVEKSDADLDAEIERLEERLNNLRSERETRAAGDPSITSRQIDSLVQAGKAMESQVKRAVQEAGAQEGRRPVYPESAPPPTTGSPGQSVGSFFDPTVEEAQASPSSVMEEQIQLEEQQKRLEEARRSALSHKDTFSQAQPIGQVKGMDAYKLPSVEISPRGKSSSREGESRLDSKDPRKGTENPHFKPR